ncbi:MAG: hypothetical protein WC749_15185 [Dehalococcoidia bacterium]
MKRLANSLASWLGCLLIFGGVLVPLTVRQLLEYRLRRLYRQAEAG